MAGLLIIIDLSEMSRKRFFSAKEACDLLQTASDDESFSDNDTDRESDCLSDHDYDGNSDITVGLECDDEGDPYLHQASSVADNSSQVFDENSNATVDYNVNDTDVGVVAGDDDVHESGALDSDNDVEDRNRPNDEELNEVDKWITVSDSYTVPTDILFDDVCGVLDQSLTPESSPVEILNKLISEDVISLMVSETNRFAEQYLTGVELKPKSRSHCWHLTDNSEMRKFIGILYLMGIVRKPEIRHYWSSDPVLSTPIVNEIMSRNRLELLLKFWHFSNNEDAAPNDRLHKLRGLFDLLLKNFQSLYRPGKQISIDEAMVLWRGRLIFRQYIPGKRHKYGVKLYELCPPNGYVWNVMVYCGRGDQAPGMPGLGHAEKVVLNLASDLLDQGRELYVDNFYTSVPLAKALLRRKTLLCGTLRRNRKFLPPKVLSSKLKRGQVIRRRSGRILVLKWQDKREVLMLSTIHPGKVVSRGKLNRKREEVLKPDCVMSYNDHMGGVDRSDQLSSYYNPLRKSLKWYRKVMLHMFDVSMTNAYLVYKELGGVKTQLWFRLQATRALLHNDDAAEMSPPTPAVAPFVRYKAADMSRLVGRHFLDLLPATSTKKIHMKKCVVCKGRGTRKETIYFCKTCFSKPALWVVPCFELFHTLEDLQ